jgi:glutathione S-transferase
MKFYNSGGPNPRMLDFMKGVGQPLDPTNKNLTAWFERMKARPSAAA